MTHPPRCPAAPGRHVVGLAALLLLGCARDTSSDTPKPTAEGTASAQGVATVYASVASHPVRLDGITVSRERLGPDIARLAADSLGGRVTGSAGSHLAATLIRHRFDSLGLVPLPRLGTFDHSVPLTKNIAGDTWIEVNGERLHAYRDLSFFGFRALPESGTLPLRFVGRATDKELEVVQDGEVIITAVLPGGAQEVMPRATSTGAAAMIYVLPDGMETTITEPEVAIRGHRFNQTIPVFFIPDSIARRIWTSDYGQAQLGDLSTVTLRIERMQGDFSATNIVGVIPGSSRRDEIVLLGAHYDGLGRRGGEVYNGADDNASGIAALLAIAEAWAARAAAGERPQRTLVFAAFDAEEHGNLGSEALAASSVLEPQRIAAMVNLDMVGRRDDAHRDGAPYVYALGMQRDTTGLAAVVAAVAEAYDSLTVDRSLDAGDGSSKYFERSDQWSFARRGVPSLMLFGGVHEDYHLVTDDVERVNLDLLGRRVRFTDLLISRLANPTPDGL